MPQYFPFEPNTRSPKPLPPPKACDSQFHVFGSREKYPVRPGTVYEAPEATFAEARKMHRILGITRGVIVQSTAYGIDHRAVLDALAEGGKSYRGVGVINDTVSDAELRRLHEAGIRGARFNFYKAVNFAPSIESFSHSIPRIRELGWFAKLHLGAGDLIEYDSLFKKLKLNVVIDHLGRPDMALGLKDPNVMKVVDLLKTGNWWVMLSNGHKQSKTGYPWNDAIPIARAYIEAAPDRVIWSSDWPHPLSTEKVPNDADLLELLYRYAPDEGERKKILVDNPATLFGFEG
jgi:predicted TIM-barrel fold metal-dependent hydrolase